MSRTSVWQPNEMAMTNTEGTAISGVMSMPKTLSATITAMRTISAAMARRNSGIMVLMREAGAAAASPSAIASAALLLLRSMYGSVAYLKSSQATKAINSVIAAVRDDLVSSLQPLSSTRPSTSTTQRSAIVTNTPISTATRTQRATTSGSLG